MNERFEVRYQGYLLHCAPDEIPGGWFSPKLVVSYARGGSEHEVVVPLKAGGPFKTQAEAADWSYTAGIKWVQAQ